MMIILRLLKQKQKILTIMQLHSLQLNQSLEHIELDNQREGKLQQIELVHETQPTSFANLGEIMKLKRVESNLHHYFIDIDKKEEDEAIGMHICQKCEEWKRWALLLEQYLITIERQLIQKEGKLYKYMNLLQNKLKIQNSVIEDLKQQINRSLPVIQNKEDVFQPCEKISVQLFEGQTYFNTPLKHSCIQEDQQGNRNKKIVKNNNINETVKRNIFITNPQKMFISKQVNSRTTPKVKHKESKYIFQNTILKQYNQTLLLKLSALNFKQTKNMQ